MRRLLAGLCVLALAPSAAAEGAWVLWGHTQDPWGALVSVRLGGWPSRAACEQERSSQENAPPALRMASYSCLPDTIDPPGSKRGAALESLSGILGPL
jgi:hypothetical protein